MARDQRQIGVLVELDPPDGPAPRAGRVERIEARGEVAATTEDVGIQKGAAARRVATEFVRPHLLVVHAVVHQPVPRRGTRDAAVADVITPQVAEILEFSGDWAEDPALPIGAAAGHEDNYGRKGGHLVFHGPTLRTGDRNDRFSFTDNAQPADSEPLSRRKGGICQRVTPLTSSQQSFGRLQEH